MYCDECSAAMGTEVHERIAQLEPGEPTLCQRCYNYFHPDPAPAFALL